MNLRATNEHHQSFDMTLPYPIVTAASDIRGNLYETHSCTKLESEIETNVLKRGHEVDTLASSNARRGDSSPPHKKVKGQLHRTVNGRGGSSEPMTSPVISRPARLHNPHVAQPSAPCEQGRNSSGYRDIRNRLWEGSHQDFESGQRISDALGPISKEQSAADIREWSPYIKKEASSPEFNLSDLKRVVDRYSSAESMDIDVNRKSGKSSSTETISDIFQRETTRSTSSEQTVSDVNREPEKSSLPRVFQRSSTIAQTPVRPLQEAGILSIYGTATTRLLLFDYDGTLTNIVNVASQAVIPNELLTWLSILASEPRNTVWVISGRDKIFLEVKLGNLKHIGLVAEHGAFMRRPNTSAWENLAATADLSWQTDVKQAFEAFMTRFPGSFIEKKEVAVVLHYRQAEIQQLAALYAAECKAALEWQFENSPVEIVNGKCVVEARPADCDKGHIVRRIIDEINHSTGDSPEFVLCAGDDITDEGYMPNFST